MMTQAFYTGLSGLKSNSYAIDVVSDNLANISTVGFRSSEYEFASLFETNINTSSTSSSVDSSVGVGSRVYATSFVEDQGQILSSDRNTDLAIHGDGWFGIQEANDIVYTRDGTFNFDANNDLVSLDGFHVLGTMGGNINGETLVKKIDEVPLSDIEKQEKLRFPKYLVYPQEATTTAKFIGNIGAEDEIQTMGAGVVDPENNKNSLKLVFTQLETQTPPGTQWSVVATTESLDGLTIYDTKEGLVNFDGYGALISTTLSTIDNNGAPINIDLGSGYDGVISTNNTDITSSSIADGTIGGDLNGYSINMNGEVIATFTNGMQSSVCKIAVYHFQNDQGLERLNGSKFRESSNSGEPIFYKDSNGKNIIGVEISNFKLESSNVDMTYGLTELIILQRSYDANSKSVTTADEMMQKALNMSA
jgi:flagellar hook protein FlgE